VLRNRAQRLPYFHDDSVDRLVEAVRIMAKIQLLKDQTKEQVADGAAFLSSMTGRIPKEALKMPALPSGK